MFCWDQAEEWNLTELIIVHNVNIPSLYTTDNVKLYKQIKDVETFKSNVPLVNVPNFKL